MVVHGAAVFRAAAAFAGVLGGLLGWLVPQAVTRYRTGRMRRRLGASIGPGELRAGAAVTVSGRIAVAEEEQRVLVIEEARIALRGTVELLGGAHGLPAGKGLSPTILREGDRVRLRGLLQHDPVTDRRLDYRAIERRWELVPEGWGDLLLSFETSSRLGAPSWRQLCEGAGAGLLIFLGVLTLAGDLAARATAVPGSAARATTASLITLASPAHREQALTLLAGALSQRCNDEYGQEHLDAQLRIADLREDCGGASDLLLRHGQLERAAQRAHTCGDSRAEAHAHYLGGHFAQASEALERAVEQPPRPQAEMSDAVFALRAHLLARRFALAAREASKAAGAADPAVTSAKYLAYRRTTFSCLAEALDRRAQTSPAATPTAAETASDREALSCRLLHAEATPGLRTLAFLHADAAHEPRAFSLYAEALALEERLGHADAGEITRLCAAPELHDPPVLARPLSLFGHVQLTPALGPPALARKLVERLDAQPGRCALRGHLEASLAGFEAVAGDRREARRWAERMERDLDPEVDQGRRGTLLRAAIAAYTGELALARSLLDALPEGSVDLRGMRWVIEILGKGEQALLGARQEQLGVILGDAHDDDPWSLTAQGDGTRLARFLQQQRDAHGEGPLLLAPPRLERGRDDLLSWYAFGDGHPGVQALPLRLLTSARNREAALEALGDPLLAAREREVAEAFSQAVASREVALPLAILDEMR
jgi:hypothetical protein